MTGMFVIRNQHGHYWGKRKLWLAGDEPRAVLRTRHEDEAVNILFELSAKDIELRGEVVQAPVSERGDPLIEPSDIPVPCQGDPQAAGEPVATTPVEGPGSTAQEPH